MEMGFRTYGGLRIGGNVVEDSEYLNWHKTRLWRYVMYALSELGTRVWRMVVSDLMF